jgi:hypothetical protein
MIRLRLMAAALLPVLAACAHAPVPKPAVDTPPPRDGRVSYGIIPTGAAGQYHMEEGQTSFGAQTVVNDPPVYPASLVPRNLPVQTVRAKVIVDAEGKVSEVRDLDAASDATHAAFFKAAHDAAMQWSYTPMTVVEEYEDAKGQFSETRKNEPFSFDYAFQFELKDGVPTVSATR